MIPVVLGRTEAGTDLVLDLAASWHTAIQGMSRSGKSVLTYLALAGVAHRPDVVVCGLDPTGILLNPWRDHPGQQYRALGTSDMPAMAATLQRITDEMDRRIGVLMETYQDKLDVFTASTPLLLVVLEEYPGTLSAAEGDDAASARKPAERVATLIQRNVRRLVQEGAKAGIRLLLIAQRMDASIVGGAERSNLGNRLTMRVDNADAVKMLHPMVDPALVERVTRFVPGVGIIDRPGAQTLRFKADLIEYRQYVDVVRAAARLPR